MEEEWKRSLCYIPDESGNENTGRYWHTDTRTRARAHTHTHTYTHTHTHTHTDERARARTHTRTHTHARTHITHTHTRTHARTHARTHIYIYITGGGIKQNKNASVTINAARTTILHSDKRPLIGIITGKPSSGVRNHSSPVPVRSL